MRTIKGPAIFLAQFAGDTAPFDTLDNICGWAADLGYKGVQIPTWASHFIDVEKAATSKTYADEVKGIVNSHGLEIAELASHIIGQLVAVHPAYDTLSDGFAIPAVRGNPKARQEWAVQHLEVVRGGQQEPRPQGARHLLGRARLAVPLSVPAAAGWPRRRGLRRAGAPLDPDPRRVRPPRRRRVLRDPSERGSA